MKQTDCKDGSESVNKFDAHSKQEVQIKLHRNVADLFDRCDNFDVAKMQVCFHLRYVKLGYDSVLL